MIGTELPDKTALERASLYEFAKGLLRPISRKYDQSEHEYPKELDILRGGPGFFGGGKKKSDDGKKKEPSPDRIGSNMMTVLTVEEMCWGDAGMLLSVPNAGLGNAAISAVATEEQLEKFGSMWAAMAITEPDYGSDAIGIQTSARKEGNHYVLNGSKTFITNAPVANTFLLYATTDRSKGLKAITAFIIEEGFEGFSVSRKLAKMGMKGSPTGELALEDCIVPEENVLGEENGGVKVMFVGLDIERIVGGSLGLGVAQGAFDLALEYSKVRTQFGKPISSFQLIQQKLSDMYTNIEAARVFN